jgi:hypothetical protein
LRLFVGLLRQGVIAVSTHLSCSVAVVAPAQAAFLITPGIKFDLIVRGVEIQMPTLAPDNFMRESFFQQPAVEAHEIFAFRFLIEELARFSVSPENGY